MVINHEGFEVVFANNAAGTADINELND